ncbi:hypothetical protein STAQ_27570 [Allostella sp. ATCC 35155]|nr:hypothetical protein STAQ_27570 [Stella sp. ATCC 35155]
MLAVTQLAGFGAGGASPPPTFDPTRTDAQITLSGGNLSGSATSGPGSTLSTGIVTGGKFYTEVRINGLGSTTIRQRLGIARADFDWTLPPADTGSLSWVYFARGDKKGPDDSGSVSYGDGWSSSDVVGLAVDRDAGKVWFALNNSWQVSGDPAAGTGAAFEDADMIADLRLIVGTFDSVGGTFSWTWRSSPADHSYAPPSGFSAVWPS